MPYTKELEIVLCKIFGDSSAVQYLITYIEYYKKVTNNNEK